MTAGQNSWNYSAAMTVVKVGTFLMEVYVDGVQVSFFFLCHCGLGLRPGFSSYIPVSYPKCYGHCRRSTLLRPHS